MSLIDCVKHELHKLQLFYEESMKPEQSELYKEKVKQQIRDTIAVINKRMQDIQHYQYQLQTKIHQLQYFENKAKEISFDQKARLKLNIGGKVFETTVETLVKNEPRGYFAIMLSNYANSLVNDSSSLTGTTTATTTPSTSSPEEKEYFIDRSPEFFQLILDHLRCVNVSEAIAALEARNDGSFERLQSEVQFYRISSMFHFFPALMKFHVQDRFLLAACGCKQEETIPKLSTASSNCFIKMWDLHTYKCVDIFEGHHDDIYCIQQLSKDLFASGSFDKTIRIWNKASGKQERCIHVHEGITALESVSQHSFAAGTELGNVFIYSLVQDEECTEGNETGDLIKKLSTSHSGDITCMKMVNPYLLAVASYDNHIRIWNVSTGEVVSKLSGHLNAVTSLAVIPFHSKSRAIEMICNDTENVNISSGDSSLNYKAPSTLLVSGSDDKTIRLWDIESGECVHALISDNQVESLCYIKEKHYLASGHDTGDICIWDLNTLQHYLTLEGHNDWVYSLESMWNGNRLISSSHDCSIRIWDLNTGECVRKLEQEQTPIWSLFLMQ